MSKLGIVIGLIVILGSCQRNPYTQGQIIFETYCLNCHMEDGGGLGELYPQLRDSEYLTTASELLPCLIRNGRQSAQLTTVTMPPHKEMTEASMTNLINYINYKWGNQKITTLSEVTQQLENCSKE